MAESLKERMRRVEESKLNSMGDVGQRAAEAEAKVAEFQKDSVTKANHEAAIKAEQQARANAEAEVQRLKNDAPKKADGTFYTKQEIDNHIATIAKKANGVPYSQQEVDALAIKDASGNPVDQAAYDALVAAQANPAVVPVAIKDANGNAVTQADYNTLVAAQANPAVVPVVIKDANGNPVDQAAYDALVTAQANVPVAPAAIKDANAVSYDPSTQEVVAKGARVLSANEIAVDQIFNNKLILNDLILKAVAHKTVDSQSNDVFGAKYVTPIVNLACTNKQVQPWITEIKIGDAIYLKHFCENAVVDNAGVAQDYVVELS